MISFDEFLKQDEADKYNMLQECNAIIQQKENIIKKVKEEVRIYEEQSNDGITNELDDYVFIQRLKNILDKKENWCGNNDLFS